MWIAKRLTASTGVVLEPDAITSSALDQIQPFGDGAIRALEPIVKCMDVVSYSNIIRFEPKRSLLFWILTPLVDCTPNCTRSLI